MKKSLRKVVSLVLVIAVLMTSMLVVSAVPVTRDPMQTVLFDALKLSLTQKEAFNSALSKAATDLDGAAADMKVIFPTLSVADAKLALEKYKGLDDDQKALIQASVLAFSLNPVNASEITEFGTIVSTVNKELTGDQANNDGISLMIQIIKYLNKSGKNGAYVTDLSSDTSKIAFVYSPSDYLVALAMTSVESLIGVMDTLNAKISSSSGSTTFDKLLSYTASKINEAPAVEIKALKEYLKAINPSYYQPYVAPGGGGTTTPTPTPTPTPAAEKNIEEALKDLTTANPDNGAAANELKKQLEAAIQNEIAKAGTTSVTPTVVGTTATVTADQIKVSDIVAKAEAVIAKAAEIAKVTGSTDAKIEKKVVIDVDTKDVANVNVQLQAELFAKVQEKGIDKVEIASGDIKLSVAPDFAADVKSAKTVSFDIKKVAVTDELKAKMTDEQKTLLASNATVLDFNAAVTAADGTEKKITKFDKKLTIKVKYSLKEGEDKDKITVLYFADDGSIKNMIGRYDAVSGEVVFETDHFSTYVVKNLVKRFGDVASSAWYKSQVESLASKGIVEGRAGNNFVPNGNVTRAEFVTMLVKAKGVYDENAEVDFDDVSKDEWFYTYVASAVKANIVSGVGNNKFAPNSLITREEMAVMLANALGEKTVENASKYLKASDANKISSFAKNGVALCVKNDFLVGSKNKLDPKGKATRGMAAVVVYKYFNFIY